MRREDEEKKWEKKWDKKWEGDDRGYTAFEAFLLSLQAL